MWSLLRLYVYIHTLNYVCYFLIYLLVCFCMIPCGIFDIFITNLSTSFLLYLIPSPYIRSCPFCIFCIRSFESFYSLFTSSHLLLYLPPSLSIKNAPFPIFHTKLLVNTPFLFTYSPILLHFPLFPSLNGILFLFPWSGYMYPDIHLTIFPCAESFMSTWHRLK